MPAHSGPGKGAVGFSLQGNFAATRRSGLLTIGGQTLTIVQSGVDCGPNISVTNGVLPPVLPTNTTITLNVNAPASCQWSASVPPGWVSILSGSFGTGPGNVQLGIAGNASPNPRMASIQIGGSALPLTQLGVVTTQFYMDVATTNIFLPNINLLVLNNVNSGCTATEFCPERRDPFGNRPPGDSNAVQRQFFLLAQSVFHRRPAEPPQFPLHPEDA